jgi:hypothetical protein
LHRAQFISFIAERPLENEPFLAHWRTFGCRAAELRAKFMAFLSDSLKSCRILHRETREDEIYILIKSAAFIVDLIYSQLSENEAPDGDGFCDTPWIHKIN